MPEAFIAPEHATWLAGSTLLLAGRIAPDGEPPVLTASSNGAEPLASRAFPDAGSGRTADEGLLFVRLPQHATSIEDAPTLQIAANGQTLELTPERLRSLTSDVRTFVRHALAPLDAGTRAEVLTFLSSSIAAVPEEERPALSDALIELSRALRERLPRATVSQSEGYGVHVDRFTVLDSTSVFIEGWLHDDNVRRLTVVSPEGGRAEILDRMFRFPRPDVAQFFSLGEEGGKDIGFGCFVELSGPSLKETGWVLEIEDTDGSARELTIPPATTNDDEVWQLLLNAQWQGPPSEELLSKHAFPALSRMQHRVLSPVGIESVTQFGDAPQSPEISIVVPIYQQLKHLEIQLSQFADDPDWLRQDLIYVLDSPEQKGELLERAAGLFPIYRIPFRIAVMEKNAGFAGANNAGASLARGPLLLLMNSDILPSAPGWLSKLRDFYESTPDIGALCPKLLYEDDSIQHAGSYFYRRPGSDRWVDAHYFKGMHRSLPAANVARPVPVVSGACMMIARSLYDSVGGLSGTYVQGDYEDSDICLQMLDQGRSNWYLPDVELYHLEGQSYSPDVRVPANRYNAWLHTERWSEKITQVMSQLEDTPA